MLNQIISEAIILSILTDPIGNVIIFVSLLKSLPPTRQRQILVREALFAGAILMIFAFFGNNILTFLKISSFSLDVSGGVLLFLIALKMIFPDKSESNTEILAEEPLIVPMAMPMIAGPASLGAVIVSSTGSSNRFTLIIAILLVTILNIFIFLAGNKLIKLFGQTGLKALAKLMGLALITIAVQMIISGLKSAFT